MNVTTNLYDKLLSLFPSNIYEYDRLLNVADWITYYSFNIRGTPNHCLPSIRIGKNKINTKLLEMLWHQIIFQILTYLMR